MILDYKENLEFALANGIKPINNIGEVHFTNSKECKSDGPFLVIDSQGCTHRCIFDSITCTSDQGYVIYSVYGKKSDIEVISECSFINCTVESEDGKLCYCAYFKPFSSFRTVRTDNVDHDTCDFVKHAENDT